MEKEKYCEPSWECAKVRPGYQPTLKVHYSYISLVIYTIDEFLLYKIQLEILFMAKKMKQSHFSFCVKGCIQSCGKLQLLSRSWGTDTFPCLTMDLSHHHKLFSCCDLGLPPAAPWPALVPVWGWWESLWLRGPALTALMGSPHCSWPQEGSNTHGALAHVLPLSVNYFHQLGVMWESPTSFPRILDLYECPTAIQQKITKKFATITPWETPCIIEYKKSLGETVFVTTLNCK